MLSLNPRRYPLLRLVFVFFRVTRGYPELSVHMLVWDPDTILPHHLLRELEQGGHHGNIRPSAVATSASNWQFLTKNIEIAEQWKGVHCVNLGESFQTHIYLQKLASVQPLERALSTLICMPDQRR